MSLSHYTLGIIKPTAVMQGHIGGIIQSIEEDGFTIKALEMTQLSKAEAELFYAVHDDKPFYQELCEYISSGKIVAIVLKKEDAVKQFRNLIGHTDPLQAAEGTIRKKFGVSIGENAIHGSDSVENATQEIAFFFRKRSW